MKKMLVCAIGMAVAALISTDATSMPAMKSVPFEGMSSTTVQYRYGPVQGGLYGHRRPRPRRSYGTGYHGRGTRTGGPAGGLPGRS